VRARPQRILLKLSGELLAGAAGHGIDEDVLMMLAEEVRDVHALGIRSACSSAAATSSAAWRAARAAWTAAAADRWACWRPSSTASSCTRRETRPVHAC
jgi:hypothetical protein